MLFATESTAVTAAADTATAVDNFTAVLPKLGEGLLGIFIVTAIIIISIVLLNTITGGFGKRKKKQDDGSAV